MKKATPTVKKTKQSSKQRNQVAVFTTGADARTALLVVSITINLFIFCLWVALQVTGRYDQALYNFFIHR